jgi:NNP family nitrate/nitrite transporter-like MFS transporter
MRKLLSSILHALRSGHWPSLVAAWLHFEVSFMVWVLIGALGVFIAQDLNLTATQKGFMVAVPLLGGSVARIFLGVMTDRYGPRRTGTLSMLVVLSPLAWAWLAIRSFADVLTVGLFLGIAGASFAVALPLASRAYPIQHQGLAMGVAGSGNSGAILSIALAPLLAGQFGWRQVFGLMLPLVAVVAVVFWHLAQDHQDKQPRSSRTLWNLLHEPDAYWFCLFYSITFGGFVGFCSYLSIFFFDQYNISGIEAGWAAGACALAGSFARPIGGFVADRWGGLRVLSALLPTTAVLTAAAAFLPPFPITLLVLFLAMSCLGMGNGVIFQVVPQRFRHEIGRISGVIGAAGGLGGFLLPSALGFFKDLSGTFATGFAAYALVCLLATPAAARFGWVPITDRKTAI